MSNLKYWDYKKLPHNLIDEVYNSLNNIDRFPIENDQYKSFEASQALKNFTKDIFDFEHNTAVQVLYKNVDIHIDLWRTLAYNYIIDTGGPEVKTCFYNESNELIESYIIKANQWHSLNVETRHNVVNIVRPRIAITVHNISEIPPEYRW